MHSKTHEGEKCYKCEFCPYASISARHLESHLLIHTDQKPYLCTQCEQTFRQKQLLKRHMNFYHNPNYVPPQPQEKTHVCPSCKKSFRHKGNLIRHMAMHDPNSSIKEEAIALKLGRQKRIRLMGGNDMGLLNDDEDEEEIENGMEGDMSNMRTQNVVSMEGDDGQQYVVLEVIQIPDQNGDNIQSSEVIMEEDFIMSDDVMDSLDNDDAIKSENDVKTIHFGFDEVVSLIHSYYK